MPSPWRPSAATSVSEGLVLRRRVLAPLLAPLLALLPAIAVPAWGAIEAGDYHHTRWTAEEGAPQAIRAMAQTADGWLWLGTRDGLYRFDGLHFTRYPLAPALGLNRNLILSLHAGPRGELYIGRAAEGISVLQPDGRVRELPPGPARGRVIEALAVDADGSVWIVSEGIYRLQDGHWQAIEDGGAGAGHDVRSFVLDSHGQLWMSRETSTWRLNRQSGRVERILDLGGDLLSAPDGRLWLMSGDGAVRPVTQPGAAPAPLPIVPEALPTGQFAPDGALWTLRCPDWPCVLPDAARRQGAYKLGGPAGAGLHLPDQMSGKTPATILVDREGATWIGTESGLDRFRRKRIVRTGLDGDGANYSLATDAEGRVWAAHTPTGELWLLLPDRAVPVRPRHPVTVLARDAGGALLLGGKRSIWRNGRDGVQELPLPPGPGGKPVDMRMMGILDDGKVLWTATLETGLIGWRGGNWHPRADFNLPSKIYQSGRAGPGQLWLATGDGQLFHYDVATNRRRPPVDIRALGITAAIFPGAELVLSGDNGTGIVRGGALSMLRAADPNALRNVSGLVVDANGDRWLNGAAGLVHVRAADWARSAADPALPLRCEVFDGLDGYPGRAVFENRAPSAWSADGRMLWLVTTGGVVRVDTANLDRNRIAPVPMILSLSTDKASVPLDAREHPAIRLAAGTERLRIDFTAPSLRMPERVRFETMLEGVDAEWQDAGTRRTAFYTSVKPGDYVFHLRAVNEDGVRSTADAVLPFVVEPTFRQTAWFKLLAAAALAMLLFLAYRYRVRYLTRRVAERMHVKMAERERIARTLHDTFLQTVQSLLLRVDAIAAGLPKDDGTRRQLETVVDHAGSALGEGREQLQELRSGGGDALEDLLDSTVGQLRAVHVGITIGLRTEGQRRPVRPDVAGEAAAIAREALHNACIHAAAGQVRAVLSYAAGSLALSVSDDGRGIDGEVLRKGAAAGRWGLVGMRERAQRIGAALDIAEGSEGGTVVRLTVPAARAYAD
jgi:signal transduction histidine kinase/ligand-binding sensor domain-containing protein